MIIKHKNQRGKRTICICKNCGCEFSELNIKINEGGGKFCSNECYKAYRKKNAKDVKELNRLYQKKNKYNLSKEEYYKLFLQQNNKCAICGCEFTNEIKGFVDHDHKTGIVRGLLCSKCNSLLGFANDDIYILTKAIQYLKRTMESE